MDGSGLGVRGVGAQFNCAPTMSRLGECYCTGSRSLLDALCVFVVTYNARARISSSSLDINSMGLPFMLLVLATFSTNEGN